MYDTIIIGAGMSGLAAGIRLAYYDQRVCILERHTTIGGLNSFYRLNHRNYDVGLHAVTNFSEKGAKRGPLSKILRQLRFRWEDFALAPQKESRIAFPGIALRFSNDLELFRSEIAKNFPEQSNRFDAFLSSIMEYDELDQAAFDTSGRARISEAFTDPLLVEMLLCPLMWYGNSREHDISWGQLCVLFRSIFMEGFARPFKGVRLILRNLVKRFRELGGELRLRRGVKQIIAEGKRAVAVELDNGEIVSGQRILSSAGHVETLRMCSDVSQQVLPQPGQMSFIESISVLDCKPEMAGYEDTIVFFNDSQQMHWSRPTDTLCDVRTGVICSPNNYEYEDGSGDLPEGLIRLTALANSERWQELDESEYRREKNRWYDRSIESCVRFIPDFRRHVVDYDIFTPSTIRRFTWHDNGAVYGAPDKKLDGTTHLEGLYLCGSDQGYVGIIGAMLSGIAMANRHCLPR